MTPQALQIALQQQNQPQQGQMPPSNLSQALKQIQLTKQKNQQNNQAAIAQAAATLTPNANDTLTNVGQAIQSPAYAGYCLQWVDDQTGNKNRQPTAYADYQTQAANGNIDSSSTNIPKGARVYFAPDSSNGGMGHVGLSNGDGTFTAATDNGIQTFGLSDWQKYAGQQYLGYSKPSQSS